LRNKILVDASFRIEDAWFVEKPESYEVEIVEPLRKADGALGFVVADVLCICVTLQSVGLVDWVIGKGYDQLWEYLKGLSAAVPWSPIQRNCNISVTDQDGSERISVDIAGFDAETIGQAELEVKNEISRMASGDIKETYSVQLKFKNGKSADRS
jgi:hypothetical protein